MRRGFRQLKWEDRIRIETMLKAGHRVVEIAEMLGVHRSTIYNELKRGQYVHTNTDLTEEVRYSPEIAQEKCEENLKVRGTQLKIGNNIAFANYIEEKIVEEGYSPAATLGEMKVDGKFEEFDMSICVTTLYSYIDKGIFLCLSNKNLPVKKNEKRGYEKVQRQKRCSAGESISNRPEHIDKREEFGHWEMDSVVGARGKSKNTLVVLTERKTRQEIVFKVKDHSSKSVVEVLDNLERRWGEKFKQVFKTITVDNGTEFSDYEGLKKSLYNKEERTKVYYCHPYSSWERGSNENQNKLIRRHIPKGSNFDNKTDEEITSIEKWINNYPRKIFGWRSSQDLFSEELKKIC